MKPTIRGARLFFTGGLVLSLGLLGFGAYNDYAYLFGTPTTATIKWCVNEQVGFTCTGTWSVGGQSQTGKLQGTQQHRYSRGSSLDVRVRNDKAYTAFSGVIFAAWGLLFGLLTAFGVIKFASEEWFDPWLSRRPKWFQHVIRFARNYSDNDVADSWS